MFYSSPHMRMPGTPTPSQQIEELYGLYAPSLYRRARWITGEPEESLDITQATFLSFMLMTWRGEASPYVILYSIVTHKAVDRLRRRARWTGKLDLCDEEDVEDSEHRPGVTMTYEGGLSRLEAAQDLALLTQEETPKVLTAAFLYFVEGHSAQQVGQVLNLSRKKVEEMLKGFLKRARARRNRLAGGGSS